MTVNMVIHFYDKTWDFQMVVKTLQMMMIMEIDSSIDNNCSCYTVLLALLMAVTNESDEKFDYPKFAMAHVMQEYFLFN